MYSKASKLSVFRRKVNTMQKLIELYEMVSLNDTALRGSEKTAILKAQLALRMFERAIDGFKNASIEARSAADGELVMAA
jgi:hypothetical protein